MKFLRRLGCLTLLVLLACGFAAFRVMQPYQGFSGDTFVEFAHGTSTDDMADTLAKSGIVRSRYDFLLAQGIARITGRRHVLQAGEYRFQNAASALEVASRIARGDVFYYTLVVPEGKNMFDIAAAAEELGIFPASHFVAAARMPDLIHDLDPKAPTLEGYLFPNTYKLSRHTTPEVLCRTMTGKFREVWRSLETSANVHDIVTLASLVEREGKVAEDRPMIASVFDNRLRTGMKLDCDPTTIYAALLENRYRGTIYRSDLNSTNPYNTYQHAGLPPGPIANPGLASIRAALHPAQSDALFFVLRPDGSGRHEFTNNIGAHNAAAGRYHRGQK